MTEYKFSFVFDVRLDVRFSQMTYLCVSLLHCDHLKQKFTLFIPQRGTVLYPNKAVLWRLCFRWNSAAVTDETYKYAGKPSMIQVSGLVSTKSPYGTFSLWRRILVCLPSSDLHVDGRSLI